MLLDKVTLSLRFDLGRRLSGAVGARAGDLRLGMRNEQVGYCDSSPAVHYNHKYIYATTHCWIRDKALLLVWYGKPFVTKINELICGQISLYVTNKLSLYVTNKLICDK